ncbi:hypothetical protein QTP88_024152 [Uroleucon formosanum]
MVKNKVRENRYYWECENRVHRKTLETTDNCTARATTDCANGVHKLRGTPTDHNYASEAHRATVIDFQSDLKKRAHSTRDKSSQILEEVITVRKIIKHKRRKSLPTEPTTLEDINIPENIPNTFIGNNYGYYLNPACIITDFEKAAINAIHNIFPECVQKGCFFNLAQNVWRKIQPSGLATEYDTDEHFSLQLRYIPALAFLEPNAILAAFNEIKQYNISIEIYKFWSVSHNNKLDIPRIQNKVESWHKRWKTLIGADHIGCLHIVSEMKKGQNNTIVNIFVCWIRKNVNHKILYVKTF